MVIDCHRLLKQGSNCEIREYPDRPLCIYIKKKIWFEVFRMYLSFLLKNSWPLLYALTQTYCPESFRILFSYHLVIYAVNILFFNSNFILYKLLSIRKEINQCN